MATQHITLINVRNFIKEQNIDISGINGNPTLLAGIAKRITLDLTGKNAKQQRDRIAGFIVSIKGETYQPEGDQQPDQQDGTDEPDEAFSGSLDDFDGDADPDMVEEEGAQLAEAETEEGVDRSVVKGKYRAEYKARGNARNCGDWMARLCDGILLASKKKLDIDKLATLCEMNGIGQQFAKYTTPEKRLANGWQGRARMSVGIALRIAAAKNNGLDMSKDMYDYMTAKLNDDNKRFEAAGKPERMVDWEIHEEIDDVVAVKPATGTHDAGFFADVMKKHGVNQEKLAEGRKKRAKKVDPARAQETQD